MENRASQNVNMDEPTKTILFEKEQSGITYRIPALIYLQEVQTFLAFAEKRLSSSDHEAKILVMRRGTMTEDGSVEWSSTQELQSATLPNHRTMNPCPVYEKKSNTVFLFFICVWKSVTEQKQIHTGKNQTRLCYVTSTDNGQTWSNVTDLTETVIGETINNWATFGVGPGHGVQLEDGRLIIPAYAYYIPQRESGTVPRALAIYSKDDGKTWRLSEMLREDSSECEMAEIIDHEGKSHLYCNARSITKGHRCEALSEALSENSDVSFDQVHFASELVEPPFGCQGSIIAFPAPESAPDTQTWLLFMHPTHECCRRDMGVYLNRSPLQSSGWETPTIIHSGPSGYSDLAYHGDKNTFSGLMECGEESELEQIAFVTFSLNDVMQQEGQQDED
ncbi:hypothetical protein NL108_010062 [Boleophthalmus pectinirostris]|uniref:sialidase-4-like n=1 Tax=Boleophthalmus pectinirostris TaxID=150288 RepID=UPI00242ABFD8|nr:sialidase-4-like [Boleophthalmus pectinirostris]XP_055018074.1 sialidase-4-like [Boleophthalmus pectinirostris]KAJ0067736.1 hypothetical protein NL108_010062 [Boleophthalmus pectinirostris]